MIEKKIVKEVIKTVVKSSVFIGLLGLVSTACKLMDTVVAEAARNSEITRLKGDTPLAWTVFLSNYNNNIHIIATAVVIILGILVVYALYDCVKKIINIIKEGKNEKNS